jgi:hypothetical protein
VSRRVKLLLFAAVLVAHLHARLALAQEELEIRVQPASVNTTLGEDFTLTVHLTNSSQTQTPSMTAHLMIVDPDEGLPLDPEDWTDEIAQKVDRLEAGESTRLEWIIHPILEGASAMFVVLVPVDPQPSVAPRSSVIVPISIGSSEADLGLLFPVAIGVPALIGFVLASQMVLERRRRHRQAP